MTKQARIVTVLLVLIILIPLVVWGVSQFTNRTSDGVVKDKDTGEVLDTNDPGEQTGGGEAKQSDIVLFGTKNLAEQARAKNTQTGRYLIAIQEALWSYGENRLKKEFPTLTVRPQNLIITQEKITGEVRIGQTDTIVPFEANITPNKQAALVTINKDGGQYGGTYVFVGGISDSEQYLFTITQKNDTSSDLRIQSYGGYWEAALQSLVSSGYDVTDFSIELVDFQGVFK